MAGSQYLYQVAVDTGSTLRAAQNVKQVFQREMAQVSASFSASGGGIRGGIGNIAGNLTSQIGDGLSQGLSGGLLKGLSGGLAGGIAGVVAGITVGGLTQAAGEMAALDSQAKSSERALTAFAGSAGIAEQRIRAVQEASGGAVSRLDAMRIANQGAALGFGKTSQELARVTNLAAKVSTVFGGDLTGNIENMAAAAANLSFVRLDTLGISADETRKRFEELRGELGDTAAFMQAMLEVGEKTFDAIDPNVSGVAALTSAMQDLKTEWAAIFGPVGNAAQQATANLVKATADGLRDMRTGAGEVKGELRSAEAVVKMLEGGLEQMKNQAAAGYATLADVEEIENKLALARAEVERLGGELSEITGEGIEDAGVAADGTTVKIQNMTDAAEQFKAVVAGIAGTDWAPRFSPSYTGGDNAPSMRAGQSNVDSMMENLRLQTEESRRQLIEEGRANTELAREQSRLAKSTAADTTNAWQRAAQNVQSAWEKAVGSVSGIPGVTGRSQVTELDMRLAEFGLYQSKPDEFLRQAEDQLLNGVDRGISRNLLATLTAQSTGFDLGKVNALPNDLLAQLFGQEYESGRLFSTPLGQGMANRLFDTGAVAQGMEQQQAATAGGDFIKRLLGDNLPEQFATVAGDALKGLRDGLLTDDLTDLGSQAMDNMLSAFTDRTSTSPQVEAAANSLIAEFFRRYQEALNGGT